MEGRRDQCEYPVAPRRDRHARTVRLPIEIRPARDRVLVCPQGELDIATASQLCDVLIEVFGRGFGMVVADLRAVTFIDLVAVRELRDTRRYAETLAQPFAIHVGNDARHPLLAFAPVLSELRRPDQPYRAFRL